MKTKMWIGAFVVALAGVGLYAGSSSHAEEILSVNVEALCSGEDGSGNWVPDHRDDFGGMMCCVHDRGYCSWIDCNDYY